MQLQFNKAPDSFLLIRSDTDTSHRYKIEILEAKLHLHRIRLTEDAHKSFNQLWIGNNN